MGHKFLLKSDPIHPKPTDAGHDAGHDGHSLCFLDILGSAWKREPHHRDEILEPSWARSWWEAIPLRFRCERSRTLMTSEHSGCVASENSSCCRIKSSICRTVYRNSMHMFAVQLSLMYCAPTAMVVCASWFELAKLGKRPRCARARRSGVYCVCIRCIRIFLPNSSMFSRNIQLHQI